MPVQYDGVGWTVYEIASNEMKVTQLQHPPSVGGQRGHPAQIIGNQRTNTAPQVGGQRVKDPTPVVGALAARQQDGI